VQVGRFNEKNDLVPYHDRGEIEEGALGRPEARKSAGCGSVRALSISIPGLGARDSRGWHAPLRVNLRRHNGHPYTAVGRVLIERNLIRRDEMSMQRIRDWMAANRDEAPKVRATNRSFVFFRIQACRTTASRSAGAGRPADAGTLDRGRQDACLTARRSSSPKLPIESAKPVTPFRRLMMRRIPARPSSGRRAPISTGAPARRRPHRGRIRHPGDVVMLLPRELDMIGGASTSLPVPAEDTRGRSQAGRRDRPSMTRPSRDDAKRWTSRPTTPSRT